MKILEVVPHFPPFVGGVERTSYIVSKELARRGHDVTVLCTDERPRTEIIDGITVKRLGIGLSVAGAPVNFSVLKEIRNADFDLLSTNIPTPWLAFCAALAKKNRPFVVMYHNDIIGKSLLSSAFAWLYNRTIGPYILSKADKIIVHSPTYAESSPWLKHYASKIEIIGAGVDAEKYRPENASDRRALEIRGKYGKPLIFLATALGPYKQYKGVDVLLEAAKLMKGKEKFMIVITGEGPLKETYRKAAEAAGLSDCVDFIGEVQADELPFYYAACDVFVFPSINNMEGFGLVAIEAMASGKPVVASRVGGIPFAVGSAGVLVEPKDPQALAEAILGLLRDPKRASELGNAGRKRVLELFQTTAVVDKREKLYESLLKA